MMATLTEAELKEAVKEWCDRRGVPCGLSDITFEAYDKIGNVILQQSIRTQIRGITMPPKEGPYR